MIVQRGADGCLPRARGAGTAQGLRKGEERRQRKAAELAGATRGHPGPPGPAALEGGLRLASGLLPEGAEGRGLACVPSGDASLVP